MNDDIIDDLRGLADFLEVSMEINEAERADWLDRLEQAQDHIREMCPSSDDDIESPTAL